MPKDKFLIAPFDSGLQDNLKPWLIPDDALAVLDNLQIYQGRIIKRFGTRYCYGPRHPNQLESRLRYRIGTLDGAGVFPATVVPGHHWTQLGQMFSVTNVAGVDVFFTVRQTGFHNMVTTLPAYTGTYSTVTGRVALNCPGAPGLAIYYYPTAPVMGFLEFEDRVENRKFTFAFDGLHPYAWLNGNWINEGAENPPASGSNVWTSANTVLGSGNEYYFTGTMFRSEAKVLYDVLFVTNNYSVDYMRYYTWTNIALGTPVPARTWNIFRPIIETILAIPPINLHINAARVMVNFKDRLILMNLTEEIDVGVEKVFPGKVRWCAKGDPLGFSTSFLLTSSGAGYLQPPNEEAILSAYVLRDHLIVFFERSIYELVYTFNETAGAQFIWKEINGEFGTLSTLSLVPVDWSVLTIGESGIYTCNGAVAKRIDSKIPLKVPQAISNLPSLSRIAGIRDYLYEFVFWTFPRLGITLDYPFLRDVVALNYVTGSWSTIKDTFTAFGYFLEGNDAPSQEHFRRVIAGNQQGFVTVVDYNTKRNAGKLSITNFFGGPNIFDLIIYDHALTAGDYILIEGLLGTGNISFFSNKIFKVTARVDRNTIQITKDPLEVVGVSTYTGGGTVSLVTPPIFYSKDFNFYLNKGRNAFISKASIMFTRTTNGEVSVDFNPSSSELSLAEGGLVRFGGTDANLGDSYKLSTAVYAGLDIATQQRVWHSIYLQAEGETLTLRVGLSDNTPGPRAESQIRNVLINESDFEVHAILFEGRPSYELNR